MTWTCACGTTIHRTTTYIAHLNQIADHQAECIEAKEAQ